MSKKTHYSKDPRNIMNDDIPQAIAEAEGIHIDVEEEPLAPGAVRGPSNPSGDAWPTEDERKPRTPPKGFVGSYATCGACGDFLEPNAVSCPRCAPAAIATPPRMMAK